MIIRNRFDIYRLKNALVFSACLFAAACSDSGDSNNPGSSGGNLTDPALTAADATVERFGARTTRNLTPNVDAASVAAVVSAINNFSLDLHRAAIAATPDENSISSGYSAAVAFSLALAGTSGDTLSALANLLGVEAIDEQDLHYALNSLALELESRSNDDLVLRTANRVFVRPDLAVRDEFLDIATSEYGAPVVAADFDGDPEGVKQAINGWVNGQTDGFIPSIIGSVDPNTVFALLNAIFLDATWQDEYQPLESMSFTSLSDATSDIAGFTGRSGLPRIVNESVTAIELPYGGGELAMLIAMPTDFESFEASLNATALDTLVASMTQADVLFQIPNWEDSADLDLIQLLASSGLPSNPWSFNRLVDGELSLQVFAKQKARIEVDENGTRAAAVTIVGGATSLPETIRIDRPFIYVLRDRTSGTVLFTGRVLTP